MPELKKIESGVTVLCELNNKHTVHVSLEDKLVQFVIHEKSDKKERFIVNGKSEYLYDKVFDFTFSPFPGYFYKTVDKKKDGFVVNGKKSEIVNSSILDINCDGKPVYLKYPNTENKYPKKTYFDVLELEYQFYDNLIISEDFKNFAYQSATYPEYNDFKFIVDNKVCFNGWIDQVRVSRNPFLLSWMGSSTGEEDCWPFL